MNDATRHHGTYNDTWTAIKAMKGEVVETSNAEYGDCNWTVIDESNNDYFEKIREEEEKLYQTKDFISIIDNVDNVNEDNYNKSFWYLWPETVDRDLEKLNGIVDNDNMKRKEQYKRTIKKVSKSDFFVFHALIIAASAHSGQGEKLWKEEKMGHDKNEERG